MSKIKIGVFGAYRGSSMINYCKRADNAEIVAICDKSQDAIGAQQKAAEGLDITFYDNGQYNDVIIVSNFILSSYEKKNPKVVQRSKAPIACPIKQP